ncbi:MAG: aspartate-semialdehyde dehydrogenase [Oscillospiraceae bacterium]|nr:aspartate-semialdehyde dehydrogenase [Oscillospiraceae bacterium]
MTKKVKLAIVGATGLVGRTILKVLEEKNLPVEKYVFFASAKSAGKEIKFLNQKYIVQKLTETSFDEGFDIAIFSAGSETAKIFVPYATKNKCIIIDNSSCFRQDETVPLVIPEVNPNDAKTHKYIISNPNCSTIQCVVALKPLDEKYSIKRIVYSTYQAVSGAGQKGIDDLINTSENRPPIKFAHPIFNNCLPHIDSFLENGYSKEEMKMINETRKILHKPNLPITATTVRVPVMNSHSIAINVEFEKQVNLEEAVNLLKNYPGVIVMDDIKNNIYPLATLANNKNEVFVGRIRIDESVYSGLNLWVVADNLRKGAATNAVQILELLMKH